MSNTSSPILSSFTAKSLPFRQLFYLITPSEANYQHFDQVPDYISSSVPYFLGMIAVESLICILCKVKPARAADGFSSTTAGMSQQIPRLLFTSLSFPIYFWVYENCRLVTLPWDSPFAWYISFFLEDLAYYFFHRYSHEVAILWGAHQVHHSSEDYNLTTALRQSTFQQYFSDYLYIPMALVIPPSHYLIHRQLNTLFQFWIHTEHRLAAETANRLNESLEQEKVIVDQQHCNLLTLQNERDDLHRINLALTMSMEEMVDYINTTSLEQDELAEKNRILTETNASLEEEQNNLKGQLNEMAEFQDQSSVCSVFASNASNVNMSGDMDGKALDHIITLQNIIWSLQEVIRTMKD